MCPPYLRLLALGITFLSFYAKGIIQPAIIDVLAAPVYYYMGHKTNEYSKQFGKWTVANVFDFETPPLKPVFSLDLKFSFIEFTKRLLSHDKLLLDALQFPLVAVDAKNVQRLQHADLIPLLGMKPADVPAGLILDHTMITSRVHAYHAGIKYLTMIELYGRLGDVWKKWKKMHNLPDEVIVYQNTPLANGTDVPEASFIELIRALPLHGFDYAVNGPIQFFENLPSNAQIVYSELAKDPDTAITAATYFTVAYIVTKFTQQFGEAACDVLHAQTGLPVQIDHDHRLLRKLISVGIGFSTSFFLQPKIIYDIEEILKYFGAYNEEADELNATAYIAAFKGPFAWEGMKSTHALGAAYWASLGFALRNDPLAFAKYTAMIALTLAAVASVTPGFYEFVFEQGQGLYQSVLATAGFGDIATVSDQIEDKSQSAQEPRTPGITGEKLAIRHGGEKDEL